MARPAGVRNQDYEDKRTALLEAMLAYVECEHVVQPSLRQLAIGAGVSDVSLRHYFGDRRGVVIALFDHLRDTTRGIRETMRQRAETVSEAISIYLSLASRAGSDESYIRQHVFALREAMADGEVYAHYQTSVLEPAADALGEGLVKSSNGVLSTEAARQAASHIVFNAMFLAMQRLIDPEKTSVADMTGQLKRFTRWITSGLEADIAALKA